MSRRPISKPSFIPDTVPQEQVFSIEVIGEPDQGKTHFSATFPKALFLDTEHKADIVLRKMPEKGHVWKRVTSWQDIELGVEWALQQPDIRTIVIDSGGDIRDLALEEWKRRTGKKSPVAYIDGQAVPVLWAQVYEIIDNVVRKIQLARKYLVVTCRTKDEYIAHVPTGRKIRDGYKKFPWIVRMAIWIQNGITDPKSGKVHFKFYKFGKVIKNNFWGVDVKKGVTYQKPYLFDISYEGICNEMLKPWGPVKLSEVTETIIKEAEEWLKEKGLL